MPVTTDVVLVPATANDPILSDVGEVAGLTVQAGALVDQNGFNLTVTGDLDVQGQITNGLLLLTGAGSVLQGTVDGLDVNGARALSGALVVTGNLVTNATLTIGSFALSVTGDLTTAGASGRLFMSAAAGTVDVEGDVLFDGTTTAGWLTDGQILVAGNFTATSSFS